MIRASRSTWTSPPGPLVAASLVAVLVMSWAIGAPRGAATTWCDPELQPDGCADDAWPEEGPGDGASDDTIWFDDGTVGGFPADGTDQGWSDTEWVDGDWVDGEWVDAEWVDGEWVDGEWDDPTWLGDGALPPEVLAMVDGVDRGLTFDPSTLPIDVAARTGAARLVLGVDALAELGAFRRDPDPAVNDAVRSVRDLVPADGLNADGYRAELSVLADDIGELVELLEVAGPVGDPLLDVESALADGDLLDELADDGTALVDPQPWLAAAADLLLRGGIEPASDAGRDGDLPAVLSLAAHLGGVGEGGPPPSTITTGAPADDAGRAAGDATGTIDRPPDGATTGAPTGDGGGPWLLAALPAGLVLALGGAAMAFGRRRSSPPSPPVDPKTATTGTPIVAGQASLEDLLDVSRRMTSSLDEAEVAAIALAEAERLVDGEGGLLAVTAGGGFRVLCHRPAALFDLDAVGAGSLRRVVESGRSVVQVTDDEPTLVEVPMAMAAIPVVAEGRVAGAILVVRVPSRPFARQELDGLEMLAPLIGSALLAAETHGSATQLADVDPLSGLSNRRRLTADLEAGAEAPLAAIMIDVDHFKHFNDTNGHAAGDEALRRVASLLADNVRPGDVVYRYGGEEFCVLLPGTSLEDAVVVAERVRTAVEAADIPGGQRQPAGRVTVSVGVARCEPGGHDRVIDDADAALYRAKHGGRNRVCGPA